MFKTKSIVLNRTHEIIPDIFALEKIGAGHDGIVFKYGDKAIKLLKYDASTRSKKGLMTSEKAIYFIDNLDLQRIAKPIDTFSNFDDDFLGYVMNYLESSDREFSCADLFDSICLMEEDFKELTANKILAGDINRGSFIYTNDFLHLCDTDKYQCYSGFDVASKNNNMLNFVIAKMLYFKICDDNDLSACERKILLSWVKRCSNQTSFLTELKRSVADIPDMPVGELAKVKMKKILH